MSKVTFIAPVDSMRGKLNKNGKAVFRRKRVYDSQGNVIGELAQESYVVEFPRDWKKNPPKGAEKDNIDNWRIACQRTKAELADDTLRAAWQQRWEAQLAQPEQDAPIDPRTNRPKIYIRLACFVRAVIYRSLAQRT